MLILSQNVAGKRSIFLWPKNGLKKPIHRMTNAHNSAILIDIRNTVLMEVDGNLTGFSQ